VELRLWPVQHYKVFLSENLVNFHILPQTCGYNFTVLENLFRITCASWMCSSKDPVLPKTEAFAASENFSNHLHNVL